MLQKTSLMVNSKVVAGPIVRRAEASGISIWIALQKPAEVELEIFDKHGALCAQGISQSQAIGKNIHIALVSAHTSRALNWGEIYEYELKLDGAKLDIKSLLYPKGPKRLSLVLPGRTLQTTHLFHGSCRHPNELGPDALTILDTKIEHSFSGQGSRPQLFVSSGDAIYADTPSPSLLKISGQTGKELLGYSESLPDVQCDASEIPPKKRKDLASQKAQIIDASSTQLFGFGEYLALHLLVISPLPWPKNPPEDLCDFIKGLSAVRRALANTAYYAIFDDHEVTDDWYLTRFWSQRVLGSPLGRRMICNALSAFALIHAWGNQPEYFQPHMVGNKILEELAKRRLGSPELECCLGLPPKETEDAASFPDSLPWHFKIQTPAMDLRVLDTRTMRSFPHLDPHGEPEFIHRQSIAMQLSDIKGFLVLVVPSPFAPPPKSALYSLALRIGLRFITSSAQSAERNIYIPDRGDLWNPTSEYFGHFLSHLPKSWVCLGGDTHISYSATLTQTGETSAIFCSSGMKRESRTRRWRQMMGFSFPLPWTWSPALPSITTKDYKIQYLESEKKQGGKSLEYMSENNIGELIFLGQDKASLILHSLWKRNNNESIEAITFRVSL